MTIDRRNSLHINQGFTKVDLEIKTETDRILHLEIDPLLEEEIKVEIGEIIITKTITSPIIEIDWEADGTIIGQLIGVTITRLIIDEVIPDQIMDKIPTGHLETEVKVEIELKITTMTIWEVEVEVEIMIVPFNQDKALCPMEEMNLGPDQALG